MFSPPGCNECVCLNLSHVSGTKTYLLVKVLLVIWFQTAFPMKHLEPARGCALQIASKKGLHTRKGARLTSHLKKLGGSLTWLLQDCLSIPHLS